MPFGVPMMWREGKDHVTSCNFCMANLKSINPKNKQHGQYTGVPSAIKPVPMAQIFLFLYQMSPWNLVLIPNLVTRLIQLHVWSEEDDQPVPLTQAYFNDLTRDLNFQGFYPATGFSSLGDRSTRTWNNILLVLRTSKRI